MNFSSAKLRIKDGFRRSRSTHIPFLFILAAGLALRFYRLGHMSIWRDEIETMVFSLAPTGEIIRHALEIPFIPRPPLYYFLTRIFLSMESSSYMLRFPAALASGITLVLSYYLARRWFGSRVALLSSLFLSLSPFQVHYAQEGREYAFLMMLSLLSLVFLDLVLDNHPRWIIPWSGTCLAVLYTHHFGALIFFSEIMTAVIMLSGAAGRSKVDRRRTLLLFLSAAAAVMILWGPILGQLLSGLSGPRGMQGLSLYPNFSPGELKVMFGLMALGNGPGTALIIILAIIGSIPFAGPWKKGTIISFFWIMPPLMVILFGKFDHAIRLRYCIFIIPLYFMAAARGASILDHAVAGRSAKPSGKSGRMISLPVISIALALAAIVWTFPYLGSYYREERANWRAVAAFLDEVAGNEDLIVVTGEGEVETNFQYFILDHYAGLGPRSTIVHLDLAKEEDLRDILKGGHAVWYAGTRWRKRYLFRLDPSIPRDMGYTSLPPIVFQARTELSPMEKMFLAPFRYQEIAVIPVWPGRLSKKEVEDVSMSLIAGALLIPDGHVDTAVTAAYLRGERNWSEGFR